MSGKLASSPVVAQETTLEEEPLKSLLPGLDSVYFEDFFESFPDNVYYPGCISSQDMVRDLQSAVEDLQSAVVRLDNDNKKLNTDFKRKIECLEKQMNADQFLQNYLVHLGDLISYFYDRIWMEVSRRNPTLKAAAFFADLQYNDREALELVYEAIEVLGVSRESYHHLVDVKDGRNGRFHANKSAAEIVKYIKEHRPPPQYVAAVNTLISLEATIIPSGRP